MNLLILTGTVGVGKTTVGEAIADELASREIPHAFIDRDAFCRSWPPVGRFNEELAIRNIGAVWRDYREVGIDRLIVAGVVAPSSQVPCGGSRRRGSCGPTLRRRSGRSLRAITTEIARVTGRDPTG